MEKRSIVAVVPVRDSVHAAIREAMELISWQKYLVKGKPTSLKVNLGWDLFIPGSITSPWVIEGIVQTIRDWVGPLYLVESDQVLESIEKAFRKCNLHELCEKYNMKWVNTAGSESVTLEVPGGKIFPYLEVPKIYLETQMITVPVMKTHAKTQITGAIKNQWGCISKLRHNYHLVLSEALAEINTVVKPALAVMDATIGLEGNGPKSGIPIIVDRILASSDIVAIDTLQAKMMGLDPSTIAHLNSCAARSLGTNQLDEIEIVGEKGARDLNLRFQPAEHNLVSKLEEYLRRSRLKKLFFDTPVFLLMLAGAKIWYLVWFYFVSGKKHWSFAIRHPLYGKQWEAILRKDP